MAYTTVATVTRKSQIVQTNFAVHIENISVQVLALLMGAGPQNTHTLISLGWVPKGYLQTSDIVTDSDGLAYRVKGTVAYYDDHTEAELSMEVGT